MTTGPAPGRRGHPRGALLWIALAGAVVLSACGGDDDVAEARTEPERLVLVSSGATWRGEDETRTTFDVSEMKTDPTNFGVAIRWEFATDEPEPDVDAELRAGFTLDGFAPDGNAASLAVVGADDDDREGLSLETTERGFVVRWRLDYLLGASDLSAPDDFAAFVSAAGVNAQDVHYTIGSAEDAGGDGVLVYDVILTGDVEVGDTTITIRERVRFDTVETDPSATFVARDQDAQDAVERQERIAETAGSGCPVVGIEVSLPLVTLTTSDGAGTIEVDVPDGWDAEIPDYGGPCPPNVVTFDVPDDDGRMRLGPGVLIVDPYADTLTDHLAANQAQANTRLDDDGEEITLQPGDQYYETFEEAEAIDVGGLEAYLVRSSTDYGDGSSVESEAVFVDLGTEFAFVHHSIGPFFDEADFADFLGRLTFTVS